MKKKTWDRHVPIYEKAMRSDQKTYELMYSRIPDVIQDKEILEGAYVRQLSAGTGIPILLFHQNRKLKESNSPKLICIPPPGGGFGGPGGQRGPFEPGGPRRWQYTGNGKRNGSCCYW